MDFIVSDWRVPVAGGSLYAHSWLPFAASADAPAILLFHDSLGSVALWRDFPAALAMETGLQVIAYDRLGFGQSEARADKVGRDFIADEAKYAQAVLDAHGIERFIAFGHSVGGAMAVATAAALPDRCVAVITESSQAFVEDHTLAGVREAKIQFANPEQAARLDRYHGQKTAWVLDAWIETWLEPGYADWSIDAQAEKLKAPLLALHGDKDEFGTVAHPTRFAEKAGSGGLMHMLEGIGHVPHREAPERVLPLVMDFLQARNLLD